MPSRPPFHHASTSFAQNHVPKSVPRSHTPNPQSISIPLSASSGSSVSSGSSAPSGPSGSSSGGLGANLSKDTAYETCGRSTQQDVMPYSDFEYPPEKSESVHVEYAQVYEHPHLRSLDEGSRGVYGARHGRAGGGGTGGDGGICDGLRGRLGCAKGRETGQLGRALIIGWVGTTVLFILATAFWKGELFRALDRMSVELREMGHTGQAIFAFLIFLTTVPPLPLYSTLMVLSGYTFGAGRGFLISYFASLTGAIFVFIVSRTFLRDCITKCLADSPTSMSLLSILPSKPHLLLLIRIAPYPFNLLNVILASSPALTLGTYTSTTAISLLKVILHTWFGSGIHDISQMHAHKPQHSDSEGISAEDESMRDTVKMYSTWAGVILCLVLVFYLHHVAKRALRRAQDEAERDGRLEAGDAGPNFVSVRIEG